MRYLLLVLVILVSGCDFSENEFIPEAEDKESEVTESHGSTRPQRPETDDCGSHVYRFVGPDGEILERRISNFCLPYPYIEMGRPPENETHNPGSEVELPSDFKEKVANEI